MSISKYSAIGVSGNLAVQAFSPGTSPWWVLGGGRLGFSGVLDPFHGSLDGVR